MQFKWTEGEDIESTNLTNIYQDLKLPMLAGCCLFIIFPAIQFAHR